jgi:hypothetical protein
MIWETQLSCGCKVYATSEHADNRDAIDLGYENVEQMTMEHDRLHQFLAQVAGLQDSPTLWRQAHKGEPCPITGKQYFVHNSDRAFEEMLVKSYILFKNMVGDPSRRI